MNAYAGEIEVKMRRLYGWLSEKDWRRYEAIEAAKLGRGGIEYMAHVLSCDPITIRQGLKDLDEVEDPAAERVRKKRRTARANGGAADAG